MLWLSYWLQSSLNAVEVGIIPVVVVVVNKVDVVAALVVVVVVVVRVRVLVLGSTSQLDPL